MLLACLQLVTQVMAATTPLLATDDSKRSSSTATVEPWHDHTCHIWYMSALVLQSWPSVLFILVSDYAADQPLLLGFHTSHTHSQFKLMRLPALSAFPSIAGSSVASTSLSSWTLHVRRHDTPAAVAVAVAAAVDDITPNPCSWFDMGRDTKNGNTSLCMAMGIWRPSLSSSLSSSSLLAPLISSWSSVDEKQKDEKNHVLPSQSLSWSLPCCHGLSRWYRSSSVFSTTNTQSTAIITYDATCTTTIIISPISER